MSEGSQKRGLSAFARRFVERKLEQLTQSASRGAGSYYELYAQNFTDSVDRLLKDVRRADLRDHIVEKARATGDYVEDGFWRYDHSTEDVCFTEYRRGRQDSPQSQVGAAAKAFAAPNAAKRESQEQSVKPPRLS